VIAFAGIEGGANIVGRRYELMMSECDYRI
jgi:hypothetical protein